jgi:UDP-N-acetylmuramoyl-L-alanyl-D-glutamate--2,6-diaminopimelate ligase
MISKICVTGTKGKTTVVNFIAEILQKSQRYENVLLVNTTGHFLNGVRRSTLEDSLETWSLVPSVAPGRYLYEFLPHHIRNKKNVAVLEASLGSSTLSGLGYGMHHVGVFLNIFEDHIGSSKRIKNKNDILKAKIFVAQKLYNDSWLAMNADDLYVMKGYHLVNPAKRTSIVLFGIKIDEMVLEKYPCAGYVTREGEWITYYKSETRKKYRIVKCKDVEWTMDDNFTPSVYNLMAIISAIICLQKGSVLANLGKFLRESKMPENGGRLTKFVTQNGVTIIADYAHEKYSLKEIGELAKKMTKNAGRTIGVVRLAYDRTDALIKDTGNYIAKSYDNFIVYDKIDGFWKKAKPIHNNLFVQENGKISKVFYDALLQKNPSVERIIREDKAIKRASEIAKNGDVVVIIVNDNIERSISFIKKYFKLGL